MLQYSSTVLLHRKEGGLDSSGCHRLSWNPVALQHVAKEIMQEPILNQTIYLQRISGPASSFLTQKTFTELYPNETMESCNPQESHANPGSLSPPAHLRLNNWPNRNIWWQFWPTYNFLILFVVTLAHPCKGFQNTATSTNKFGWNTKQTCTAQCARRTWAIRWNGQFAGNRRFAESILRSLSACQRRGREEACCGFIENLFPKDIPRNFMK